MGRETVRPFHYTLIVENDDNALGLARKLIPNVRSVQFSNRRVKPCIFLKLAWEKCSNRDSKKLPDKTTTNESCPTATKGRLDHEGRESAILSCSR
jgi:hypothetical protein